MQQRDCSLHPLHPDQLLGQYWRGLQGAAPGHRHPRLVPGQPPGRGGQECGVLQPSHRDQCSESDLLALLSFFWFIKFCISGRVCSLHLLCCCSHPGRGDKVAEVQRQGILQHCQGLKEQLPWKVFGGFINKNWIHFDNSFFYFAWWRLFRFGLALRVSFRHGTLGLQRQKTFQAYYFRSANNQRTILLVLFGYASKTLDQRISTVCMSAF